MLLAYDYGLTFVSGMPLSAHGQLNRLRRAIGMLDMLSMRGRRAPTEYMIQPIENSDGDPTVLGRGSFQYRLGLTTLSVHVGLPVSSTIQIVLDGVVALSTTTSGAQILTVSLAGRGYGDYQVIDCVVQVTPHTGARGYRLYDAYVAPVSGIVGAPPALPAAMTSSLPLSALQALATLADWQMRVCATVTQSAFMGTLFQSAMFWPGQQLLWSGSIAKDNDADRLYLSLSYRVETNQAEQLQLQISGVGVATSPTWSAGQGGNYAFDISLAAYADGAILDIRLLQVVTTAEASGVRPHASRYSVVDVYTYRASYPYATPVAISDALEVLPFSTVRDRLNTMRSQLSAITTRIQQAPDVFDRMRLFSWIPGSDAGQIAYFGGECRTMAAMGIRAHDLLWVKGRDLALCYGPRSVTANLDAPYAITWVHEERITSGDAVETKLIRFDSYAGLFPGVPYAIVGPDIRFVHEGFV